MNLRSLDLSVLPDLGHLTSTFGSLSDLASASTDDRIVVVIARADGPRGCCPNNGRNDN